MNDSTAIQPPTFGPSLPRYPQREQLVRAVARAGDFYAARLQQFDPDAGGFRDTVPVYLIEPNGFPLASGLYDSLLIGSYLGLPLFATTCCTSANVPPPGGGSLASATPGSPSPLPSGVSQVGPPPPDSFFTPCCLDTNVPVTLYLIIQGTEPSCQLIVPLTTEVGILWVSDSEVQVGAGETCLYSFDLSCADRFDDLTTPPAWRLRIFDDAPILGGPPIEIDSLFLEGPPQCTPFFLRFANASIADDFSGCGGCGSIKELVVTQG